MSPQEGQLLCGCFFSVNTDAFPKFDIKFRPCDAHHHALEAYRVLRKLRIQARERLTDAELALIDDLLAKVG